MYLLIYNRRGGGVEEIKETNQTSTVVAVLGCGTGCVFVLLFSPYRLLVLKCTALYSRCPYNETRRDETKRNELLITCSIASMYGVCIPYGVQFATYGVRVFY